MNRKTHGFCESFSTNVEKHDDRIRGILRFLSCVFRHRGGVFFDVVCFSISRVFWTSNESSNSGVFGFVERFSGLILDPRGFRGGGGGLILGASEVGDRNDGLILGGDGSGRRSGGMILGGGRTGGWNGGMILGGDGSGGRSGGVILGAGWLGCRSGGLILGRGGAGSPGGALILGCAIKKVL